MFSVIIPNYNHAKFLSRRIVTVLDQDFKNFEIIILDDSSTDESVNIIKSYNDDRISHIVINKENSGSPFSQWQKGIHLAKYDYIWIAESDDFCENTFLQTAEEILTKHNNIVLYYCDSHLIGENEEPYKNTLQIYTKDLHDTLWNTAHQVYGKEYVEKYLKHKNFILNASSVVFQKKHALNAIKYIQKFRTSGDWLFYIILLQYGDVYFHNEKLNYFRHHENTTRSYNTQEKREKRVLEKCEVKRYFVENFNVTKDESLSIQNELINEWIGYHLLRELFSKSFFKITKIQFPKISKTELIYRTLKNKLIKK